MRCSTFLNLRRGCCFRKCDVRPFWNCRRDWCFRNTLLDISGCVDVVAAFRNAPSICLDFQTRLLFSEMRLPAFLDLKSRLLCWKIRCSISFGLTDAVAVFENPRGKELSHPDPAAGPLRRSRPAQHQFTANTESFQPLRVPSGTQVSERFGLHMTCCVIEISNGAW